MPIDHIPVLVNPGDPNPVGFGTIEDGKLTIVVQNELLVDMVEHLVRAEDIKELYLGLGFPISQSFTERMKP